LPLPARRKLTTALERWFAEHQRPLPWRVSYDPYHVWVSEVMLQQTRMEVVLRYFDEFLARFPDLHALARADERQVLAAWSGLGYYRRARMLWHGAREVVERFGGVPPRDRDALLSIPGIGRYTAGAIASISWDERVPIVDGNVARVVSRLFAIDEAAASPALMRASWSRAEKLVEACESPRAFNQSLMELGALVCKPQNAECGVCPLHDLCFARKTGRVDELPRKRIAKPTTALTIPLYVISDRKGRLLMRRESGKLMNAMYHLPHGDTSLLEGKPLDVTARHLLGTFRHTITTRRIEFRLFAAERTDAAARLPVSYAWIDPSDMASTPHPSYVAKALRLLQSPACAGG
jgi:A/G-specific adenine glycosylase